MLVIELTNLATVWSQIFFKSLFVSFKKSPLCTPKQWANVAAVGNVMRTLHNHI